MLKKATIGLAALATLGFAGSAMADDAQTATIGVNIDVQPVVSIWTAGDASLDLVMDGSDPNNNNAAADSTTLGVVSNVASDITATVTGTLPAPNGNVQIHLFLYDTDANTALADMGDQTGATNQKGTWLYNTMGQPALFAEDLAPQYGGAQLPVTFAAYSPQGLPAVAEYPLTATFTIAASN